MNKSESLEPYRIGNDIFKCHTTISNAPNDSSVGPQVDYPADVENDPKKGHNIGRTLHGIIKNVTYASWPVSILRESLADCSVQSYLCVCVCVCGRASVVRKH